MSRKEKATREYLETLSKDRVIDLCLQFMFDVEVTEQQLAEKDKEIELLKHLGNHETATEMFKENAKLIIEKRQLAIQELEKVKNKCNGMYELWLDSNYKENMYNNEDIAGVFEDISVFTNDLIKKLKGE